MFLSTIGGLQWESMETRASRRGTGFLTVRVKILYFKLGRFKDVFRYSWSACLLKLIIFFSEFRYGKAPILIATDVASRGLGQYDVQ